VASTVRRVFAAVSACLALTLVVIGAAVRGALPARTTESIEEFVPQPDTTSGAYDVPEVDWFGRPAQQGGSDWSQLDIAWIGVMIAIIAFIAAAGIAFQLLRRFRRITAVPEIEAESGSSFDDIGEARVPYLLRGVEAAHAALAEHAIPADAVVAAWLQLEEAAADSGLVRGPAQTPAEFTVTVLGVTHADASATRQLLDLYHRARFSSHPVGAAEVAIATDCLGRIAASWPTPAEPSLS
jgi:hypothetical protein